jgi:hypothetical protein
MKHHCVAVPDRHIRGGLNNNFKLERISKSSDGICNQPKEDNELCDLAKMDNELCGT